MPNSARPRLIEVGEQVQVGLGLAAALVLLVWLWRNMPDISLSAAPEAMTTSLAIVMLLSGGVLAATAGLMIRNLIRREE